MGLYKDKLIYDPADQADSDQVGSYLLASDGTELTHTTVGAKEALDVYIANDLDLDVQLEGIYSGGNTNPDNVGIIAHTRGDFSDTGQVERTSAGAYGTELDPGEVFGLDTNAFLMTYNRAATAMEYVTSDNRALDVNVRAQDNPFEVVGNVADDDGDSGNPVKIGSRSQAGPLARISAPDDRANAISDMYRRIYTIDAPNVAIQSNTQSVGTTAAVIAARQGRQRVIVQNLGNDPIYAGPSGVTTSSGLRIAKGATLEIPVGEDLDLYLIAGSNGNDARIFQLA